MASLAVAVPACGVFESMEAMPFTSSGTSRAHRLRSLRRPPKWKSLRNRTAEPTGFPKKLSNVIVSVVGVEFKADVPRCLAIFTFVVVVPVLAVAFRVEEDTDSTTLVAGVVVSDLLIHVKM